MYFVYLKKKARNQGANFPGDAAGELRGVALYKAQSGPAKAGPLKLNKEAGQ